MFPHLSPDRVQRSDLHGAADWRVFREVRFEHEHLPDVMKCSIEKLTLQSLRREPIDIVAVALRYTGSTLAGEYRSTVRLELEAVGNGKCLYVLASERHAPMREDGRRFAADCDRGFHAWCERLRIVPPGEPWPAAPRDVFQRVVLETAAAEETAARNKRNMLGRLVKRG